MAEQPKAGRTSAAASESSGISNNALMRSLASDSAEIRQAAIATVLKMRDRRAIEPLLIIMAGKDAGPRVDAARSLALIPSHADSLPLLYGALKHSDPFVRAAVGRAIGKWGLRESVPWMIHALTDHEGEVRSVVAKALGRLGEVRWEKWLSSSPQFGHKSGITREQYLLNTLADDLRNAPSSQQRAAAAMALPHFRNQQVVTELVRALGDDSPDVRKAAIVSLGQAGDKTAMKKLIHMLDDTDEGARKATVEALDRLDSLA